MYNLESYGHFRKVLPYSHQIINFMIIRKNYLYAADLDLFEPMNGKVYMSHRKDLKGLLVNDSNRTASFVIDYLKKVETVYRWDLFCWIGQKYDIDDYDFRQIFKFVWLQGYPDVRAAVLLNEYLDDGYLLMSQFEWDKLDNLPWENTIYKAVPRIDMEIGSDEENEWNSGLDWKWSLDLTKTAYMASQMGEDFVVISTVVTKTDIPVLFNCTDPIYELIAKGNNRNRSEYNIVVDKPDEYLIKHPYLYKFFISEDKLKEFKQY